MGENELRKLSMDELGRLTADEFKQAEKLPLIVVLDNIRSMHNVGSVFRSADAFRAGEIVLCGYTPQPPHREIHKTALGATETVAWQHFAHAPEAMNYLKAQHYQIWVIEQTTQSTSLPQMEWDGLQPIALVFGNEVNGVSAAWLEAANKALEIPQLGMKHSLNVSVAAGIVLYKFAESRLT